MAFATEYLFAKQFGREQYACRGGIPSVKLWVRAVTYMFLFGGSWFLILPALLLLLHGEFPPIVRSGGWLVLACGFFFGGIIVSWLAAYHLVVFGQGTPFPLDPTHKLVVSGPYRYVRNPQAIGTVLMVLGEIIAARSLMLLWLLPLTFLYLELLATPYEHRELTQRYGNAYAAYRARVPKWIPTTK